MGEPELFVTVAVMTLLCPALRDVTLADMVSVLEVVAVLVIIRAADAAPSQLA
jgi:hypothetical protein